MAISPPVSATTSATYVGVAVAMNSSTGKTGVAVDFHRRSASTGLLPGDLYLTCCLPMAIKKLYRQRRGYRESALTPTGRKAQIRSFGPRGSANACVNSHAQPLLGWCPETSPCLPAPKPNAMPPCSVRIWPSCLLSTQQIVQSGPSTQRAP